MVQSSAEGGITPIPPQRMEALPAIAAYLLTRNVFYPLSALLMIVATWLLMNSEFTQGTEFSSVFKSFSVLQLYELLLIGTAGIIVWKLKRLDDALTLFLIELVLLFDPTFFSDNFGTMVKADHDPGLLATVNITTLIFLVIKLYILQALLRIELHTRQMIAFVLAASHVYVLEGALASDEPPLSPALYYYLLAWMPLVMAVTIPGRLDSFRVLSVQPGFITVAQVVRLRNCLVVLPFLVVVLHLCQSAWGQQMHFYTTYLSPMLLALAVMLMRRSFLGTYLWLVDLLAALALLLALPQLAMRKSMASLVLYGPPDALVTGWVPMVVAGCALACLYGWGYLRHRDRAILYRLALIGAGGICAAFVSHGGVSVSVNVAENILRALRDVLLTHYAPAMVTFALLLSLICYLKPHSVTFLLAGGAVIHAFSLLVPASVPLHGAELAQAVLALLVLNQHYFSNRTPHDGRVILLVMMAGVGVIRALESMSLWLVGFAFAEALLIIAWGRIEREKSYVVVGMAEILVLVAGVVVLWVRSMAMLLVIVSLLMFAAGIVLTFMRERLLARLKTAEGDIDVKQGFSIPESSPPGNE